MGNLIRRTYIFSFAVLLGLGCSARHQFVKKTEEKPAAVAAESAPAKTSDSSNQPTAVSPIKTVYFAFDRSNLTSEARTTLKENVQWLKAHPRSMIRAEGRCDQRGTVEYNLALGQERATAVKQYYIDSGVNPTSISTISYGKEKPVCTEANESCWQQNRQVDGVIVPANYAAKP